MLVVAVRMASKPLSRLALGLCSSVLCAAFLFGVPCPAAYAQQWSAFGEDYPSVMYCAQAAVVDEDGNVLYSLNGSNSMAMASTTKIMTAVVALESGVSLDTVYTVSDVVGTVYGQLIGYAPGDQATLGQLLHGLLVYSGNDAAVCIAECVAGSVEGFVAMMNQKAAALGMNATHYVNPHGLDEEGHCSSALDLIELARYASQYQLFNDIVGQHYTVLPVSGEQRTYESTDALNGTYPGIRGVKTGYTYDAGNCFVGKATRGGKTLYICVLGCEMSDQRWDDSRALFDWAFSHYPEQDALGDVSLCFEVPFADNPGWSVRYSYPDMPAFRDGQDKTVRASTTGGSLSDAGQTVSVLSIEDADGTVAASRATQPEGIVFSSHEFGPLNTALFQ